MPLKFKTGDRVRQVVQVVEGTVADAVIVDGEVQFKVDGINATGEATSRYFSEDQIEAAPE